MNDKEVCACQTIRMDIGLRKQYLNGQEKVIGAQNVLRKVAILSTLIYSHDVIS